MTIPLNRKNLRKHQTNLADQELAAKIWNFSPAAQKEIQWEQRKAKWCSALGCCLGGCRKTETIWSGKIIETSKYHKVLCFFTKCFKGETENERNASNCSHKTEGGSQQISWRENIWADKEVFVGVGHKYLSAKKLDLVEEWLDKHSIPQFPPQKESSLHFSPSTSVFQRLGSRSKQRNQPKSSNRRAPLFAPSGRSQQTPQELFRGCGTSPSCKTRVKNGDTFVETKSGETVVIPGAFEAYTSRPRAPGRVFE